MITADELIQQATTAPTQPQVVYIQGGRRSFLKLAAAVAMVGAVVWAVKSGEISVTQDTVPTVVTNVAQKVQPTAYITQPAAQPAAVVPQGKYHAQPTVAPVPTTIPAAVMSQGATSYALITTPPTPYPTPTCDANHPAFVTDPVRVIDAKGIPIGEVQGWSCGSREEAVASVQQQAEAMIAKTK